MQKLSLYLLLFLLICTTALNAQIDKQLQQLLRGKTDINSIMQTVKQYYRDPATISRVGTVVVNRHIKRWKRWEWYMSGRLGSNGEFVNISQKMVEATGLQQNRKLNDNMTEGIESVSGSWALIGPANTTSGIGRVDRLAFHPTDPDIVYAGAAGGGLWRTTNGGTSWANLTPDIPSLGIGGIVVDPDNPSTIYILTGDGDSNMGGLVQDFGYMRYSIGVLKSTDGGSNWVRLAPFPGTTNTVVGYRLVKHPTIDNILYACTSQGLFMTLTDGATWTLLKAGRFYNLVFRPGSGNICYATSFDSGNDRACFWRSTTSGITMDTTNAINNQINNPSNRVDLAVAPTNDDLVYLLCGGVDPDVPGQFKGLYRSTNIGVSFSLMSSTPNILGRANDGSDAEDQSSYDLTVAVSNTTSTTVIAGGIEVWRSLNSGSAWTFRGGLHDDVHELAFHPADNKLWAASDGGVYSSTDNGINWTSHFNGMSVAQFYRMAVNQEDYLEMIAGAQDNGVKKRTNGTSFFDDISGSDGFTVAYDNADTSIYYAILNKSINRFTGSGASNSSISPSNSVNPFAMSLAVHTSLGNALFVGSDSIWRTTNAGGNWNVSTTDGGWFLRTCPSNGNRIYAAGGTAYNSSSGMLRRSDDGGANWNAIVLSENPGFPEDFTKITSINVDPNLSSNVWVTIGGFTEGVKVYFSSNSGGIWEDKSGTLPNVPVNCIALDSDNNAYIGTDNGVYYRSTTMNDWMPFYTNLPYVPVTDLIISEAEGVIRASTFGRGIWSSTLRTACTDYLNITGTLEGQEFYETSDSIRSTAFLDSTEGTKVQMRAGYQVHLLPNFSVYEGTDFRAVIGPCGTGIAGMRMNRDSTTSLPSQRKVLLHIKPGTDELETIITAKEAGNIGFVLTDANGNTIRRWDASFFPKGITEKNMSYSRRDLPAGLYYLHVMYNDKRHHFQELEIK